MFRITNLSLPFEHSDADLRDAVAETLAVLPDAILGLEIVRRSVDARRHGAISFIYTVDVI
ncbi:MAG TPA: hypothetical protein ENN29_04400, partial [Candidatus Hydrogenedentes bacterium]|nr:hypothetical protein [Candidatus Hydrogenedentota bacterium]